jgi:hypothetical protein
MFRDVPMPGKQIMPAPLKPTSGLDALSNGAIPCHHYLMIVGKNHRFLTQATAGFSRPAASAFAFAGDCSLASDQTRQ